MIPTWGPARKRSCPCQATQGETCGRKWLGNSLATLPFLQPREPFTGIPNFFNYFQSKTLLIVIIFVMSCSALCGNAKQLLTSGMCSSWEDMLWAQCKAMVDTLVEEELRKSMPRSYMPMPAEYWDNLVRLGDIFSALRANGGGGSSSSCPYQTVQTHIILEDWPGLASYLSDLEETARDPQLMRFIGHLIMTVLQLADFVDEQNVKDKVPFCKRRRFFEQKANYVYN